MLDGPDEDGSGPISEKSPHEPDEFDPSSLGPDVPEAPSAPDGTGDSEVAALFWKLVVVFNVALLALSVGPMLAYFEGQVERGLQIFLVGVIAFAYGTFRYVQFRRSRTDDEQTDTETEPRDHNG